MSVTPSPYSSVAWTRIKSHLWPIGSMMLATWLMSLIMTGGWPMAHKAAVVLHLRTSDPCVGKIEPQVVAGALAADPNVSQAAVETGSDEVAAELRRRLNLTAEEDGAGDVFVRAEFMADDANLAAAFLQTLARHYGEGLRAASVERLQLAHIAARESAEAALAEKRRAEESLHDFLEQQAAKVAAHGDGGGQRLRLVSSFEPLGAPNRVEHATYYEPASGAPSRATLLGDPSLVRQGGVTLVETPVLEEPISQGQLRAEYTELARRRRQMTEQHPQYGQIIARLVQLEGLLTEQPVGIQPLPGPTATTPRASDIYATPLPTQPPRTLPTDNSQLPLGAAPHGPARIAPPQPAVQPPAMAWTAENLAAYRAQVEEVKRLDDAYQQTLQVEQSAWRKQQAAEDATMFSVSPATTRMELDPQRRNSWLMGAMGMAGVMGAICMWLRRRALAVFVTAKDASDFLRIPVLAGLPGGNTTGASMSRLARTATRWMKPAGEISILAVVVWLLGMGILERSYLRDLADEPLRGVAMCWSKTFGG